MRRYYSTATIALALLALSGMLLPLWSLTFNAPVTGNVWKTITVYGTGLVQGPIDEINQANSYVGLEQLMPENIVALKLIPLAFIFAAVFVGFGGWLLSFRKVALFYLALLSAVPLGIQYWLYLFGHDIKPGASLVLDPFTPYVIGRYEVATFMVVSYLREGYFLLIATFALSLLLLKKWGYRR